MQLAEYLRNRGLTQTAFAALIGRSDPTVSRLVRGLSIPDFETTEAIVQATDGAVTANDFHVQRASRSEAA